MESSQSQVQSQQQEGSSPPSEAETLTSGDPRVDALTAALRERNAAPADEPAHEDAETEEAPPPAAEEAPAETPPPEPEQPAEDQKLRDQHRALSRREVKLARRDRELAAREADLQRRQADLEQVVSRIRSDDEWEVFREVARSRGVEPEVLLRKVVARASGKPAEPESAEARRIRELEARLLEREQQQSSAAIEQQRAAWKADVVARAASDQYAYLDMVPDIGEAAFKVAKQYYDKTGQEPDTADVLDYLNTQWRERFERVSRRHSGAQSAEPAAAKAAPKPRTVTNATAARPAARAPTHEMSHEERIEAIAAELRARRTR